MSPVPSYRCDSSPVGQLLGTRPWSEGTAAPFEGYKLPHWLARAALVLEQLPHWHSAQYNEPHEGLKASGFALRHSAFLARRGYRFEHCASQAQMYIGFSGRCSRQHAVQPQALGFQATDISAFAISWDYTAGTEGAMKALPLPASVLLLPHS